MKTITKLSLILLLLQSVLVQGATVTKIAAGAYHSLFLKSDGSLWAMGENTTGQLGDGTSNNANRPEEIVSSNVTAIAAGPQGLHSLFLKNDGSLWAMGSNLEGQLGDGTFNDTNQPQEIVTNNVTAIAAGSNHSLFLMNDGSLWAMGNNIYGGLGDGTFNNIDRPEKIIASNVKAIAAGGAHSMFIMNDGSLWVMGNNSKGQLGDGTTTAVNVPEQIVSSNVVAIACGFLFSFFIKNDGSLWAMGYNSAGQLGDGTYTSTNRPEQIVSSNVVAIAGGGASYSLFMKSDGSLWAMGDNQYGELGDGTTDNGKFMTNRPEQIVTSNVTAVAASFHSLFLKSDGSLWGMGQNIYGELGDGFTGSNPAFPEQIYPSPQPILTNIVSAKTNLKFSATCQFGGTFHLLASTNLTQPLTNWLPVATNVIASRANNLFSVTLTNAINFNGQQFYILQSQ